MSDPRNLDLTEALLRLRAFSGREVTVTTNLYGHFFGLVMRGHLARLETLAPDHTAISLAFTDGQSLFIDAGEAEILGGEETAGWLEFQVSPNLCVLVEHALSAHRRSRHQVGCDGEQCDERSVWPI